MVLQTKDKTQTEPNKSQELKDKAVSSKMDKILDEKFSPPKAVTPPAKEGTSPIVTETPKTYTQEDYDKAVNEAKMWEGRVKDTEVLVKERDGFKAQLQAKEAELTANAAEIERIQTEFEELNKDDSEKLIVARELKAAREERKQLKADRLTLETEKTVHSASVKLATDTLAEIAIWEMAAEYEGGDPVKLKDLCALATATSEEQYRKVADTLWKKKTGTSQSPTGNPPNSTLKVDSGVTLGGTSQISRQTLGAYSPQGKTAKEMKSDADAVLDKFFGKK